MRVENIECTYHYRIYFDKPDKNGVVYTKEAILNAYKKPLTGTPILLRPTTNPNIYKQCGVIKDCKIVDQEDDYIIVEISTVVQYGGTCETVDIENNAVQSFEVLSFCAPVE